MAGMTAGRRSILRDHRGTDELVVKADTQDVVSEVRTDVCTNDAGWCERETSGVVASEIHIEIFEFGSPISGDHALDAGADCPADARFGIRAEGRERDTPGVKPASAPPDLRKPEARRPGRPHGP